MTYRIAKPRAPRRCKSTTVGVKSFNSPSRASPPSNEELGKILRANIAKNFFKLGDKVKWKKPRSNPKVGIIVAIQDNIQEVTWVNGGTTPMNVIVEVEKKANGITYGTERVKTNVKKLLYLGDYK